MKRRRLITINTFMFLSIVVFVLVYVSIHRRDYSETQRQGFQELSVAAEQITENYLLSEQRICDAWAEYINRTDLEREEALDFLRKSQILENYSSQILFTDADAPHGYSTAEKKSNGENEVDYRNIHIVNDLQETLDNDDEIKLTRAFTDPITGIQSIAFYDRVSVTENGSKKDALLLRLVPVSELQKKWKFSNGRYEEADFAIVDDDGNYIIKGASFKNNNFYEFYRSYNGSKDKSVDVLKKVMKKGSGTLEMRDGSTETVLLAYTPITTTDNWKIVAGIYKDNISSENIHWGLLVTVAAALLAILLYDVGSVQKMNKQLEKRTEEADRANHAKSEFLSAMSHDIRTPMNAIVGMTQIARRSIDDPQKLTECLDKLSLANAHLLSLVNDILDISKIESGKIELAEEDFSLSELLENIMNVARAQADNKNIRFVSDMQTSSEWLRGDAIRLNQIYINLVSNAVKYTQSGGDVRASIREEASPAGLDYSRLIWEVKDNGVGMSEAFMQNMYSTFSRAEDKRVSKVEGTGLGLAIVKQLVDLMGGTIECSSELNKGTTFTVSLDLKKAAAGTAGKAKISRKAEETAAAQTDETDLSKVRILVAEDIEVNWEIIHFILEEHHITVDHAWDGAECVQMIRGSEAGTWDLILMDIQMPNMNGLEATREIRAMEDKEKAGIPIIAMTANALSENVRECLEAGMNSHISKPIDIGIVMAEIEKVVEERK